MYECIYNVQNYNTKLTNQAFTSSTYVPSVILPLGVGFGFIVREMGLLCIPGASVATGTAPPLPASLTKLVHIPITLSLIGSWSTLNVDIGICNIENENNSNFSRTHKLDQECLVGDCTLENLAEKKFCPVRKKEVSPRFELGSLDSKSRVLTITP